MWVVRNMSGGVGVGFYSQNGTHKNPSNLSTTFHHDDRRHRRHRRRSCNGIPPTNGLPFWVEDGTSRLA